MIRCAALVSLLSFLSSLPLVALAPPPACVQAGCDSQRTFQSAFGAVALGSGAVTVWQSNGLLSSSLSIDSRNRLYSATQGDLPQACQVDSVRGVVSWCTKLLPAQSGSVQVTVAQAGVVEWADVSVWLSDIGKLYGLRLADGNVSWSVTLPNFPTKHAVAAPLLLDPVAKFAPVNLTGVVVAHGSTLMRVQVQTGAVVWQTDLCTLVTGGGMSPCYSATAGATLIDVGTPALAKPIVLVPVVDAVLGYALVGVHARTGLLALHAPLPIGGTVFDVLTAPPLAVARKNLTLVAANAKTALYAINTTLSAPSASRIVWQGPPFALRFGVTLLGADVVFACGFGLCVARATDGQSVLASDNLMCVNDVGPFECAAQSPPLNVNGMLLVGAGVNQKSWSALNALDSRGRLLWTYSGVSGKRLQNLRTPVVAPTARFSSTTRSARSTRCASSTCRRRPARRRHSPPSRRRCRTRRRTRRRRSRPSRFRARCCSSPWSRAPWLSLASPHSLQCASCQTASPDCVIELASKD